MGGREGQRTGLHVEGGEGGESEGMGEWDRGSACLGRRMRRRKEGGRVDRPSGGSQIAG